MMIRMPTPSVAMPIQETCLKTLMIFAAFRKFGDAKERMTTIMIKAIVIP
jgi:hypothetical protein